ncbi:MAG: aminoacyl-tRNA hydrolase [Candidatus Fischerbacteria bacterium RBG_13_37_8]|uniref:Peptidyl-tRNA hydrolase n=1 Tax=Candidatus Fischerbacteria bacterium RBG_13_37_8 TaxID=1817863 RepID=A0A1F5V8J1_9BACT|nr:MAG: aminoacyl-tRNA hydrolase [Candidatus Fischerbacteria bacterium RBG_13_37_8]
MFAFAGLGNPGYQYQFNRHNIGFMAIDYASTKIEIAKVRLIHNAIIMNSSIDKVDILLIKPLTYMNRSGNSLSAISSSLQLKPQDFIIIYDDLYLPIGTIKIRQKGRNGGHKGMASIISSLQTEEIPRIKIGIKNENPIPADIYSDYVLSNFESEELDIVNDLLERTYQIIISIAKDGLSLSMNKYNRT